MTPLDYLRKHFKAICLTVVLGYSFIYAVSFVGLYFEEHPYHAASRWMLDNFQDKVRIVGPHWDDRLPTGVPEHRRYPSVFNSDGRENELPLYEPEHTGKMEITLRRVAGTDYIVFATPRMTDSIPRIPDELPRTTAFLRLLWAEKLGFKLIKTFKNRPTFLGMTFNDDLADESFSVYDHPKVTIFQNVDHLPLEELTRRVKDVDSMGPLPTMDEMLLMDEGGWVGKPESQFIKKLIPFVCAFTFLQVIAFGFWGACGAKLSFLRDRGLGLSPLLGLIAAGSICWVLAALNIVPVTKTSGYVVVGAMVLVALLKLVKDASGRARLRESWSQFGVRAELSFLFGILVVVVVWLIDPQFIALGEKVDAAYLQFFARNEVIPPVDMLNPTESMPGFYFDRYLLGWFLKGIGVEGQNAVPISMLVIGAVFGAAVFSVVSTIISKRGLAASVSTVCIVPVVLAVLVMRESRDPSATVQLDLLKPEQKQLVTWLSQSIEGAPVVVDSCSVTNSSGVSLAAGLPAFQRISGEPADGSAVGSAVCGSPDPQSLFDSMMKYGAALYIVGTPPDTSGVVGSELENGLDNRPDLFAKVYDQAGLKVYAPAFSDLYRMPLRS